MVQLNGGAHITTLAARREGVEKDHERGQGNHIAGNVRSNFISTPAGMSASPVHPRSEHSLVWAGEPVPPRLSPRKDAEG